jgi:hypothetical protein
MRGLQSPRGFARPRRFADSEVDPLSYLVDDRRFYGFTQQLSRKLLNGAVFSRVEERGLGWPREFGFASCRQLAACQSMAEMIARGTVDTRREFGGI